MKIKQLTQYVCDICGHEYDSKKEAKECESKKISQDNGVKIGDTVIITRGEGTGEYAIVESIYICDMYYGHYHWRRYWHTVKIVANLRNGHGSRLLLFDDYAPVQMTSDALCEKPKNSQ